MNGQMARGTDSSDVHRSTDGQTDKRTDEQPTDGQTDRQTDILFKRKFGQTGGLSDG